ncbi:DMT family transporter [Micromonospora sp. R77]|uniref:DMT family transporter n=1 Tax=Micromonospora sp. R77 TaxID=2925836 RepID=UPI001F60A203|nr:DMT family transporter [Micromonospora sp. R77]MCI4062454.1 DMT family transporter [Micromonospora sp. R77]
MNGDGRVDGKDRVAATVDEPGQPVVTDREGDGATYRSSTTPDDDRREWAADRAATARAVTGRSATPGAVRGSDPDPVHDRTVDLAGKQSLDRDREPTLEQPVHPDLDHPAEPPVVGRKPRASLLATLGLIVSVVGALFVLTGTLAGYGVGLGAVGAVLAVLGLIATRRRHVAGKLDALIGIAVGLAAVVLGVVALTGQFDWPTTDGDWVGRFREWLDSQFAGRF